MKAAAPNKKTDPPGGSVCREDRIVHSFLCRLPYSIRAGSIPIRKIEGYLAVFQLQGGVEGLAFF